MSQPHYASQTAEDALRMAVALLQKWHEATVEGFTGDTLALHADTKDFLGVADDSDAADLKW